MKVLVTGGAGYIGSVTCRSLAEAGHQVVVLDDFSTGHRRSVRWGPAIDADIRDAASVGAAFTEQRPDAVLHFAALAYVGDSMSRPLGYLQTNVSGTLNVLAAAVGVNCKAFVLSSSCASYGVPSVLPVPETAAQSPASPYGLSKLVCEQALHWTAAAHGLPWAALRYFNAAGADPESGTGEDHDPETHLIPAAINAALGKGPLLKVFGADYDTADGTAVRDYVHVRDLAGAHLKALEYLALGGPSGAFNIGSGEPASVRQVLAAVERLSGLAVPHQIVQRRLGDPPALWANCTKARRELDWAPVHSSLDEIVATALAWHRSPMYLSRKSSGTGGTSFQLNGALA
jgi:UDP-arabinose 4-epimerase